MPLVLFIEFHILSTAIPNGFRTIIQWVGHVRFFHYGAVWLATYVLSNHQTTDIMARFIRIHNRSMAQHSLFINLTAATTACWKSVMMAEKYAIEKFCHFNCVRLFRNQNRLCSIVSVY